MKQQKQNLKFKIANKAQYNMPTVSVHNKASISRSKSKQNIPKNTTTKSNITRLNSLLVNT